MHIIEKEIFYNNQSDNFMLLPISDVHRMNYLCDERSFISHLDNYASKENAYTFYIGDINDCIIVRDVKRYRATHVDYDGDDILNEQTIKTKKILSPYKERILAYGDGNHEDNILDRCSYNMSKEICRGLEIPYGGYVYMLHLYFKRRGSKSGRTVTVKIFCHHGWGGGSRTPGAVLTKYMNHSLGVDADICCYGHDHRCVSDFSVILATAGKIEIEKRRYTICCGTYLKTFSKNSNASYSEKGGYRATAINSPIITIWPDTGRYHQPQIEVRT